MALSTHLNPLLYGGLLLALSPLSQANIPDIWNDYVAAKSSQQTLPLPDFSYAGYARGEQAIPSPNWTVVNVRDYGAIPNDGKDDLSAIKAAINAANKKNGAIVLFPKGRYLLSEKDDVYQSLINITASNLILRGEGSGNNGTELYFKHHLNTATPSKKWTVPAMISISGSTASYSGKYATRIIDDANIGDMQISVANGNKLQAGQYIYLALNDEGAVNNHAVYPYQVESNWSEFKKGGFRKELHQIKAVQGDKITLAEPISMKIDSSYNWDVKTMVLGQEFGIENMHLKGAWQETFVHHKDAIHDGGWKAINMGKFANAWVKDVRMTDWNSTLNINTSIASSVINVTLEGHRGHSGIHVSNSNGVLVSHCHDKTDGGMFHAQGISAHASGTVFHRNSWPQDTSFDAHASFPHATLFDRIDGGFSYASGGNGGSDSSQPNHMEDLIFWNFKDLGKKSGESVRWWRTNSKYKRFLLPKLVGWHGAEPNFKDSELGLNQSFGEKVTPESLYEAQILQRKGALPQWLQDINLKYAGIENPDLGVTEESVSFSQNITELSSQASYDFSVNYSAPVKRDISVELWNNTTWVASTQQTVAAGEGSATITLNPASIPEPGSNYVLKVSIRPVGSTWHNNIQLREIRNIEMKAAPSAGLHPPSGWTTLQVRHSQMCFDVAGGKTTNGSGYHQWTCNTGNSNQRFEFEAQGDGWYSLRSKTSNKCVDLAYGDSVNGATIHQYSCQSNNANQHWKLVEQGDDWFMLQAKKSGKCLDVAGVSQERGAQFHQWECKSSGNHNQLFRFVD